MAEKADTDRDSSGEIDDRLASALRRLTVRSRDSAAGYRTAAEETDHEALKSEFEQMADERSRLSEMLDAVAEELGIEPDRDDDIIRDAHRAFLGFKSKLSGGDAKAILEEVARGEAAFERAFDDVIGLRMPKATRLRLQVQHRAARQARDYYKALARRLRRGGGLMFRPHITRVGERLVRHPVATVAVIAASALVLGTVASLSRQENSRMSVDGRQLRTLEKRLRKLEGRGRRHFGDYRVQDLQEQGQRGLEKLTRHFGGHR